MATVTENVEQSTREAWTEYAERLRGLEGTEYDQAEAEAWDTLQATLSHLDAGSLLPVDPSV
jgi:hypothetical protein